MVRVVHRSGDSVGVESLHVAAVVLVADVADAVDVVVLVVLLCEAQGRHGGHGAGEALGLCGSLPVDGVVLLDVDGLAVHHVLGQCAGADFVEDAVLALCPVLLGSRHVGRGGLAVQDAHYRQHADGYGLGLGVV